MGGMVNGFVIHTVAMDNGKLTRHGMAVAADSHIWKGTGQNAKNNPMPKAPAADLRFKCQRLGSCRIVPKIFNARLFLTDWWSGKNRFMNFLGIPFKLFWQLSHRVDGRILSSITTGFCCAVVSSQWWTSMPSHPLQVALITVVGIVLFVTLQRKTRPFVLLTNVKLMSS